MINSDQLFEFIWKNLACTWNCNYNCVTINYTVRIWTHDLPTFDLWNVTQIFKKMNEMTLSANNLAEHKLTFLSEWFLVLESEISNLESIQRNSLTL